MLRRIRNRYNRQVNGYFLCDRGRYGYEFVNSESRIKYPLIKNDSAPQHQTTTRAKALEHWAEIEKTKVIGILVDNELVDSMNEGQEAGLILDSTPLGISLPG